MLQIFWFHLVLIILLFLFPLILLSWKKRSFNTTHNYNLPPGPWKLPIIGNLHQLAFSSSSSSSSSLPHRFLKDFAKKYGPVMKLHFGQVLTVVISSPEAAKEVLQTHELVFAQRPLTLGIEAMSFDHPGGLVSSPYGEYWRQMRKICVVELLSPKRVMSFRSVREEQVWSLIESIISTSKNSSSQIVINFSEMIISMTIATISTTVYGNKCRGHDEYVALLKELLTFSTGFTLADCFPSIKILGHVTGIKATLQRIRRKMSKILDDIVDDHKMKIRSARSTVDGAEEEEDLLDVLLRLQQSSELKFELTTNHLKTVIMDVVGAGGETTATALEWAMSELIKNPRVLEKAQAKVRDVLGGKVKINEVDIQDLHYLKCIIKETLRLHPPAPLLGRESREGCQILGYDIPYKTKIVINAWALGRDPEIWENADCFEPERFLNSSVDLKGTDFEFVPFGAGRRMCPGIPFSFPNMELALAQLLFHFDWQLPHGGKMEELDMLEEYKVSCRRRNDLFLIATPVMPFIN